MKFKNIFFDSNLLNTDKREIHLSNLRIASENLMDFNFRNLEEKEINFRYREKAGYFENSSYIFERIPTQSNYQHYSDDYFILNEVVYLSNNLEEFEALMDYYCTMLYNTFDDRLKLFGSNEIDIFTKLFENFYPKGEFLSHNQITSFQKKINEKCELAKSYK